MRTNRAEIRIKYEDSSLHSQSLIPISFEYTGLTKIRWPVYPDVDFSLNFNLEGKLQ